MGEARDLADRLTNAVMTLKDLKAVAECYSDSAVAVTPDRGQIIGRDGIVEYLGQFIGAFPDAQYEYLAKHESGNVAIDEGHSPGRIPEICRHPTAGASRQRASRCACAIVTSS